LLPPGKQAGTHRRDVPVLVLPTVTPELIGHGRAHRIM
jgi:hypothetical protein